MEGEYNRWQGFRSLRLCFLKRVQIKFALFLQVQGFNVSDKEVKKQKYFYFQHTSEDCLEMLLFIKEALEKYSLFHLRWLLWKWIKIPLPDWVWFENKLTVLVRVYASLNEPLNVTKGICFFMRVFFDFLIKLEYSWVYYG